MPARPYRSALVSLLAVLALVVSLSAAAGAQAAGFSVEAETFSLPAADGQVFPDQTASGGAALLIWTNGTAAAAVSTSAISQITVRARGDQCVGAPVLQLSVDGTVAGTTAVSATSWTNKVFTGSWATGSHRIGVGYVNDIAGQGCDRNLRVDRVSFASTPGPPSSVQAERMALPAAAGGPFPDATASGGAGLLLWGDGTATTRLAAPAGRQLVVRARGDYCIAPPEMAVAVDGTVILDTPVPSSTWSDVAVPTRWPGGAHQVQVSFTNDYLGRGCDRNLRLDLLSVRPAVVPAGRLFGLSSAGPDQGIPAAVATAASLSRHLDVVSFYQAWVWNTPLPVTQLNEIAAAGARPEITWEPWDPRQGATQPAYTTASIAAGAYDSYITSWARSAAAYGKPLLLRFGHEMNGNWYPWSPAVNGGSPAAYLAAYRHVHDLFHAAGATNVSWVWSPNIIQGMPTALSQVYPGGGYVDLIGVDGYNGGSDVSSMGGWRSPQQVFDPTLTELRQLAPTVPVILNETGSSENGGDKAAWITQLFSYLASSTSVSGVLWFDFAIPGQADWRLATSTSSLNAARAALAHW